VPQHAKWMIGFGLFLVAAGFLGWAATGFAAYAKTAIVSGSVTGGLMLACGFLSGRTSGWLARAGRVAGSVFPALFAGVFLWRASVGWREVVAGEPKLYVALLLSAMTLAALVTFAMLVRPAKAPA
jgi:hypothetical protein